MTGAKFVPQEYSSRLHLAMLNYCLIYFVITEMGTHCLLPALKKSKPLYTVYAIFRFNNTFQMGKKPRVQFILKQGKSSFKRTEPR